MSDVNVAEISASAVVDAPSLRRIALFGPRSLYHDAIRCLIENRVAGSSVVHITDPEQLFGTAADVVLFDLDLDDVTELRLAEVITTIQRLAPRPVLLISGGADAPALQQLLREGIAGVVLKSSSCETLLEAIDSVSAGKVWLQRDLLAETFGESSHVRRVCSEAEKIGQLTQRERDIISVASSGMTNRQVAQKLNISEATVRHHLSSVFAKLGVSNRAELIVFAYRHGLADQGRVRLC